jgi:ribosome-associated protein
LSSNSLEKAKAIAEAALEGLAEDVVILDMRRVASFCDLFVICQARSALHIDALHDRIVEAAEKASGTTARREGGRHSTWVVLDYDDVVVHLFDEPTRAFYDLERHWADAERVPVSKGPARKA